MRVCDKFPFSCELNTCSSPCSYNLFERLGEDKELLVEDLRRHGYLSLSVELFLGMIQYTSPDVFLEDGSSFALTKLTKDRKIYPHKITSKPNSNKYNLRASEFNTGCMLSRIIQKTNLNEENIYSRIGRAFHFIMNEQVEGLVHNKSLLKMNSFPMPRDDYCEKKIEYVYKDIVLHGHPDFMFELGDILGVGDNKRSMHVKHTYFTQEAIYLLGEDDTRDKYLLVVGSRPYGEVRDAGRLPNLDVALIKKGGEVIRRTHEDIIKSYNSQAELLNSKISFEGLDKKKCVNSLGDCFNLGICKTLFEIQNSQEKTLIDVLEDQNTESIMMEKGYLEKGKKIIPSNLELPGC